MPVRTFVAPLMLLTVAQAALAADPGDAVAGKTYFTQICTQCHTAEAGDGGGEIGPALLRVFGHAAGAGDVRFVYSQALKDSKLVWDRATLDRFLNDPATAVPGTTMPIPVPDKKDRDNVVAYLQSLAGAK